MPEQLRLSRLARSRRSGPPASLQPGMTFPRMLFQTEDTDARIKALEEELYHTRIKLLGLASRSLSRELYRSLIAGWEDCADESALFSWRYHIAREIADATKPSKEAGPGRGFCPLCGAGADAFGQKGFAVGYGMFMHLTGEGRAHQCWVVREAFKLAQSRLRERFRELARQKAEEEFHERKKRDDRRKVERVYRVGLDGSPVLIDERLTEGNRTTDELAAAEQRLRDLGFEIEEKGNVVSYRFTNPDFPNIVVLADPRGKGRLLFGAYLLGPKGQPRRRRSGGGAWAICEHFELLDTFKYDLPGKFAVRLRAACERLAAHT